MPLANLTNNLVTRPVPLDLGKAFSYAPGGGVAYTASGLIGATAVAAPGANNQQLDIGIGRMDALLVMDLYALKVSAGNETYLLSLLASNDPLFGAGNVELLAAHDWAAAAAGRLNPTFCGASPVVPTPNESVRRHVLPVCNHLGGYTFRYLQLALLVGGTAPSITLNSWLADREALAAP